MISSTDDGAGEDAVCGASAVVLVIRDGLSVTRVPLPDVIVAYQRGRWQVTAEDDT